MLRLEFLYRRAPMSKAYTTKRSRRISASIAVVLALLTWFLRDYIPVFPAGSNAESTENVTLARPQIYFGPANSIAVLPFNCTSRVLGPRSGNSPVSEPVESAKAHPALADGIAESLIDLLVGIPELQDFGGGEPSKALAPGYLLSDVDPATFLGQCLGMLKNPERFDTLCWEIVYLANKVTVADQKDFSSL